MRCAVVAVGVVPFDVAFVAEEDAPRRPIDVLLLPQSVAENFDETSAGETDREEAVVFRRFFGPFYDVVVERAR